MLKTSSDSIGVLAVQGDVSEHVSALEQLGKKVLLVRGKEDIAKIKALIIPGGESTAISQIIVRNGIHEAIKQRIAKHSLPILGTCAGCVLLASKLTTDLQDIKLFNAMDMEVARNAFGRQKESFVTPIKLASLKTPIEAIFIRAPSIKKIWGNCEVLARVGQQIVAVKQKKFIALAFHPELTGDRHSYRYFLNLLDA